MMRNVIEFLFWGVIAVLFVLPLAIILRFLTKKRWDD
jgi:hypothetical protein